MRVRQRPCREGNKNKELPSGKKKKPSWGAEKKKGPFRLGAKTGRPYEGRACKMPGTKGEHTGLGGLRDGGCHFGEGILG